MEVTFLVGVTGACHVACAIAKIQQDDWGFWRGWVATPWENARDFLKLIEACGLESLMDDTAVGIEIGTASTMAPWAFLGSPSRRHETVISHPGTTIARAHHTELDGLFAAAFPPQVKDTTVDMLLCECGAS
ncbi:hypothetical protein AC579_6908 [Pseudocercospora musae]|uniref:Uncharacterized protein n=1 Tax=Pseudocercospora musae TaxID=113226 RepID=A0A139IGZ2_9PEZI|nr:hypothetical protein AC579_6908 [Pseudocercospora musae]